MRTSDTTPMIVRHGSKSVPLLPTVRKRRPSGLSLPKCFRAKVALTTATGSLTSLSAIVKSRPSSSFCPVVAK